MVCVCVSGNMFDALEDGVALCVAALGCRPVGIDFLITWLRHVKCVEMGNGLCLDEPRDSQWVTWKCKFGVLVVFFRVGGCTVCYIPCSAVYYFVSDVYALPDSVEERVGLVGQYVMDVVDGKVYNRVLFFDCCLPLEISRRYEILRSWLPEGGDYVRVQWIGYYSALRGLLSSPEEYGVTHAVDGHIALESCELSLVDI